MANDKSFDFDRILERLQNRREFLQLFGKGLGYSALATMLPACGGSSSGSSDESLPPQKVVIPKASPEYTALKRTSFGPHRDELASIKSLGIADYLDRQLDYESINVDVLESEIMLQFPLTRQLPKDLILGFPDNIFDVATQMIAATQYRQMFSQRQLYEIMVEFWSDHFNIHLVNGLGPTLKPYDDQQVIRAHALGNFRDLLHASAKSPAMLFYLVKEVARCFTGWTLRFPDDATPAEPYGEFVFANAIHDGLDKEVLGNPITAGGQGDAEQVLDILAAHPSTANFIATKLCRRFIGDSPPQAAIDTVAAAFTGSNGDIKTTLRTLFATPAFLDDADQKFTRPSEYLAALVRALAPNTAYPPDKGLFWFYAQNTLGQLPFYWPTPDGFPDKQSYWASTGGLLNRWRLSFLSFAGIIPGVDVIDINYSSMLNGADTLATVLDAITEAVLMRPLSSDDRSIILEWLKDYFNKTEDEPLLANEPEQASPFIAAVLVSSVYFHLR
jgi:hypothetical protein